MKDYPLGSVVRAGTWGAVVGGVAGFALGILLAPEEGKKVRRRLIYQLEHLAEQVATFLDEVSQPQLQGEARRTGDALVADAQAQAERIRDDIEALLGEMRRHGAAPHHSSSN